MKNAIIIYGGWEGHEPKETSLIAKEILENEKFNVTLSTSLDDLLSLKSNSIDLIIINYTMSSITPEQCNALLNLVKEGVGIAGWHGGLGDAFRNDSMYQYMIGGQFVHHPDNIIKYEVNISKDDDLLQGIEDFIMESEQYYCHIDPAINVHATTTYKNSVDPWVNNVIMPCVWSKKFGNGKVFYSSLGHISKDFSEPVREILKRGFLWASK